ncbi:hypothetical protein E2C01_044166 [Portunus trituberculatus]|uniref:Uncharacterized protein n=1 Tax=Portunus trituberculatus TaxID=210409 RepID=A0A5B7FZN4_PORTR|nr:hypothetical protein [Portunus trituberculatus]
MDTEDSKCLFEDSDEDSASPTSKFCSEKERIVNPWMEVGKKKHKDYAAADRPKETAISSPPTSCTKKILIPPTPGFASRVDIVEAIEDLLEEKLLMKFLHSGQVLILPRTEDAFKLIISLKGVAGQPIQLQ